MEAIYEIVGASQIPTANYLPGCPEGRLHSALLIRSLLDLRSRLPRVARDARAWFKDEAEEQDLITLSSCCEVLGLDCQKVRLYAADIAQRIEAEKASPPE
jgi:hypothetical protein